MLLYSTHPLSHQNAIMISTVQNFFVISSWMQNVETNSSRNSLKHFITLKLEPLFFFVLTVIKLGEQFNSMTFISYQKYMFFSFDSGPH